MDDIIEGVVRVMQHVPEKMNGEDGRPIPPYKVYNIGKIWIKDAPFVCNKKYVPTLDISEKISGSGNFD